MNELFTVYSYAIPIAYGEKYSFFKYLWNNYKVI